MAEKTQELSKGLTPVKLWAIVVGAVVSGMYFGWNYMFEGTNFVGALIATLIVTVFYFTFVLAYAELATAIPSAAGPSAYSEKAFGGFAGFLAGFSVLIEYIAATPGIAISIGAYVHTLVPAVPAVVASVVAFLIFVFINCRGIESAAVVELVVTVLAIVGVVVYFVAGVPNVEMGALFAGKTSMNGFTGIFAAIPYAVWFYLAVESGAMGAEECKNPQKDIPKAFIGGIVTLVVMALATLFVTAGNSASDLGAVTLTDDPLPAILGGAYGSGSIIVKIVSFLGLFGLIASLHGIIIGASRQAYAMARSNYLPAPLAKLDKKGTPIAAVLVTSIISLIFVIVGSVGSLVVFSCIGSCIMSVLSLAAWFVLRKKAPEMERPFKLKSPVVPIIASITCCIVVIALVVSEASLLGLAAIVYAVAAVYYFVTHKIFVKETAAEKVK
ncbi:MAG: ethanolamine permease [Lachnospiraceae bacterium]|nr:ethanolamine permease [Lachnospiraceae bacterium]MDD3617500.1 ethanolamine permease [Lachnospiraceae bacterium]